MRPAIITLTTLLLTTIYPAIILNAQIDTLLTMPIEDEGFDETIESIIEEKMESAGDDADFSEEINELMENEWTKSNINSLSPDAAHLKLQLTDYQYYQLQKYIDYYGEIKSLYELYAVEGFSKNDVDRIAPQITIKSGTNKKPFRHFFRNGRHELLIRYGQILEKQDGYREENKKAYLGGAGKAAFRYTFQSNDIFSLGISGEKDAGEEFFRGTQRQGFDFYAFHVEIKNLRYLRKIVIGDYRLNFGQGVVIGSGLLGAKGGGAGSCRKFTTGIRAVTPMNEGDFFRGAAAEIGNSSYNGTIFYSHNFYDGKLTYTDSINDEAIFEGALNNTGYHRTTNEIMKKNSLMKRLYGVHFQLNRRIFRLGIHAVRTEFTRKISQGGEIYQQFRFSGSSNNNLGTDYQLILKKHLLYGEIGIDKNLRFGILQGATFNLDPRVKMSAIFRYYDKKYIALNSGAFGGNAPNQNESGLYIVTDIVLGRKIEMSVSSDIYRFMWLQYGTDASSTGSDFICKLRIIPTKHSSINLRYDYRGKMGNKNDLYLNGIENRHRHRFKGTFTFTPTKFLKLKTEACYIINTYNSTKRNKSGILLLQDADMNFEKVGIGIKTRLAYFDTESYDERIYAYESDLLYSFTINSHYGRGVRGYMMIKYGYRWFDIWLRLSHTFYTDRKYIGSGLDKIDAPHKTELKIQLMVKI